MESVDNLYEKPRCSTAGFSLDDAPHNTIHEDVQIHVQVRFSLLLKVFLSSILRED